MYLICDHQPRHTLLIAKHIFQPLELARGKCRRSESEGEIGLWSRAVDERNMFWVSGNTKLEDFCKRDKKGREVLNDPGLIPASDALADPFKHIVIQQNLLARRDGAEHSTVNGKRPSLLVGSRLGFARAWIARKQA